MWDLIVSVPDHCLSFYFTNCISVIKNLCNEGCCTCREFKCSSLRIP